MCIFFIGISASYASDSNDNAVISQNNGNAELNKNTVVDNTLNNNTSQNSNIKAAAGEPKTLSQSQILAASKNVNNYINTYKKLPNSVTIGGYTFSMNEYAYMLSKTIYYKYNKKTTAITIKYDIKNPSSASGVTIKGKLTKAQYYTYSKNLYSFMDKNKKAPNYLTTKLGMMQHQTVIYTLNKAVYYAATHKGALPSSLSISIAKNHTINQVMPTYVRSPDSNNGGSNTGAISLADIKDAAARVNAYVNQNEKLPSNVEIGGTKYSMPVFLYLLSVAITNINSGSSLGVVPIAVAAPISPSGKSINGQMTKSVYVSLVKNVTTFIKNNKKAPNFANSPLGAIQYQTLISEFSKIIEYDLENNTLPSSITINVKSNDPINGGFSNSGSQSTALNEKNNLTSTELSLYLLATKNCQVNDATIKALAANITKGCTTEKEKALAIYNWMQKNIDYSFYYNTKKGAIGTYNAKTGNCVDQAHLSIALYRAVGLAARYVHGECTFSGGNVYGHVWAQVLIGDTWTISDTTSSRNSLGVINNWNTNTYKLKTGKVPEIGF